jgi:protein TonB
MRKLFTVLFLLVGTLSFSQELLSETDDVHDPDVIQPTFNGGGLDKFYDFVKKEFDFSKPTKPGKMVVAFSIAVNGDLTKIRIVQFSDVAAATEMIRVLQLSPKWESAKRSGKPFAVEIKLPFELK